MLRKIAPALFVFALVVGLTPLGVARADHTDPNTPLSPTEGATESEFIATGEGTWDFIRNFPANPGTDLEFFTQGKDWYASSGTLGQADELHVGQRIIRLTEGGVVSPSWVADHGSANCPTENPGGTTGLQHDVQVTSSKNPLLLIDTTDATGRCHDGLGGGLEFVDISRINRPGFEAREVHLTRHAGTSHNVTVDATRPWVVYNSSSDFAGRPWIDVLDIRSCLVKARLPIETKREACRPAVYRIPFETTWTQMYDVHDQMLVGGSAACHDITARRGRIYCAALNATLIFDVSELTDPTTGAVKGTPLNCTVVDGEQTGAKVTDCTANQDPAAVAEGWEFLGTYNHPGRDCVFPHLPGQPVTTCNSNNFVRSDNGVAVSHESDPDGTGTYMFVTDERGGGVVPPGASCSPGLDNPFGNGGAHMFDISDPTNIQYAPGYQGTPEEPKAIFIGEAVVPAETFCDIHVMEPVAGSQRFITAYYTQGTKIVDYRLDETGKWVFTEVAGFILPNANTWAVQNFKTVGNQDGTVTYYFMASDIQRGIDIFSWTGPKGPRIGSIVPAGSASMANLGLVGLALMLLPAAAVYGRRRRR
ncbi:MAG: hypothetical protein H0W27_03570 [Actinobacteria bacterium]|nr:hypothetical protein [Actinomycetota bacterium]